jgi:uncharacterized membrane protein
MWLHPQSVHFPIAALAFGALAYGIAALRGDSFYLKAADKLLLAALIFLALAILTGRSAQGSAEVSGLAEAWLSRHELIAYASIWAFALLYVWRYLRPRAAGRELWLFAAVYLLATALTLFGAHLGGRMVYEAGVGVSCPPTP